MSSKPANGTCTVTNRVWVRCRFRPLVTAPPSSLRVEPRLVFVSLQAGNKPNNNELNTVTPKKKNQGSASKQTSWNQAKPSSGLKTLTNSRAKKLIRSPTTSSSSDRQVLPNMH